jgi:hypothetical protein
MTIVIVRLGEVGLTVFTVLPMAIGMLTRNVPKLSPEFSDKLPEVVAVVIDHERTALSFQVIACPSNASPPLAEMAPVLDNVPVTARPVPALAVIVSTLLAFLNFKNP